jgi:hypothetical protein
MYCDRSEEKKTQTSSILYQKAYVAALAASLKSIFFSSLYSSPLDR